MVLDLVQIVAEKTGALRLLEEAHDAAVGRDVDRAVALDSMLEIARTRGFYGSPELVAGILEKSGRFDVRKGPAAKCQVIRRSTALVPITDRPRSTALVPVEAVATVG